MAGRAGKRPPARRRPPAEATAVWQIGSVIHPDGTPSVHPTMKPLECFRRPIAYHTLPGEIIYGALRRQRHGPDRRRDDRPALLCLRDLAGLL